MRCVDSREKVIAIWLPLLPKQKDARYNDNNNYYSIYIASYTCINCSMALHNCTVKISQKNYKKLQIIFLKKKSL